MLAFISCDDQFLNQATVVKKKKKERNRKRDERGKWKTFKLSFNFIARGTTIIPLLNAHAITVQVRN